MARDVKEILKILFPEYQIKACIDERGFIAKKQVEKEPEAYTPMSKAAGKTYKPVKDDTKAVNASNDAFENLPMELKECWIGSEKDRDAL